MPDDDISSDRVTAIATAARVPLTPVDAERLAPSPLARSTSPLSKPIKRKDTTWLTRAMTRRSRMQISPMMGWCGTRPSSGSSRESRPRHIRYRRHDSDVFLYAFDVIELNGDDMRRNPLEVRKATLRSVLAKAGPGLRFNEHMEGDGPTVFAHACKMGLEGIVSKRKDSAYRSGRSPNWLKMKNPACAAVTREAEEDWSK
jgi:hypothetical protein